MAPSPRRRPPPRPHSPQTTTRCRQAWRAALQRARWSAPYLLISKRLRLQLRVLRRRTHLTRKRRTPRAASAPCLAAQMAAPAPARAPPPATRRPRKRRPTPTLPPARARRASPRWRRQRSGATPTASLSWWTRTRRARCAQRRKRWWRTAHQDVGDRLTPGPRAATAVTRWCRWPATAACVLPCVLVQAMAYYIAQCLVKHPEAQNMTPKQLQHALTSALAVSRALACGRGPLGQEVGAAGSQEGSLWCADVRRDVCSRCRRSSSRGSSACAGSGAWCTAGARLAGRLYRCARGSLVAAPAGRGQVLLCVSWQLMRRATMRWWWCAADVPKPLAGAGDPHGAADLFAHGRQGHPFMMMGSALAPRCPWRCWSRHASNALCWRPGRPQLGPATCTPVCHVPREPSRTSAVVPPPDATGCAPSSSLACVS